MNNYIIRKIIQNNPIKYSYFTKNNILIKKKELLDKLYKIYIPPAYTNIKIFLNKNILATGIDKAGRKQYIYSLESKIKREDKKYCQLIKIGKNINKLNKKIVEDISEKNFSKNKLIAIILKIMELCNFRGGNKKYEKIYGSYGITTLHKKHIKIENNFIEINFIGKKGVINNCIINNKIIQEILKKIYKISSINNPYLFSIKDNDNIIDISINDINKYLNIFSITSKDLRTWNANILFLKNIKKELNNNDILNIKDNLKLKKKIIRDAIKKTAILLHNTPIICKNSYICKDIIYNIENNNIELDIFNSNKIIYKDLLIRLLKNKNCNFHN